MKFVCNLFLVFALLLPGVSMAEDGAVPPPEKKVDYLPRPLGFEIGGGSMFVAGVEWWSMASFIYVQKRPENVKGMWAPDDALVWFVRTRYVYDFKDHEHGVLLYPNIEYLHSLFGIAVGPQVGWFSSSGIDYGAAVRLDLMLILNIEVGYFFEKKNPYVSFLFSLSFPRFGIFDP